MGKLTKTVLLEYVKMLGIPSLELRVDDGVYKVISGGREEYRGNIREVYSYIRGIGLGLKLCGKNVEIQTNKRGINKDISGFISEGKVIRVEAKKECIDSYFSQCKNKYVIKIVRIDGSKIWYSSKVSVICPSGLQYGDSLNIELSEIDTKKIKSYKGLVEEMLRYINIKVIKKVRNEKLNTDYILWTSKIDIDFLGRDYRIMTVKVDLEVMN